MSTLKGDDYSPMERTIYGALLKKNATVQGLLPIVYRGQQPPRHASIVVNRAVTTLGDKLEDNKEKLRLLRTRTSPQRALMNSLIEANKARPKARVTLHEEA